MMIRASDRRRRRSGLVIVAVVGVSLFMITPSALAAAANRVELGSFGPDGSSSSLFSKQFGPDPYSVDHLAFDQPTNRLLAIDRGEGGRLYQFEPFDPSTAVAPPVDFAAIGAPYISQSVGQAPAVAVDNTALGSAGDIYLVSEAEQKVFGYEPTGAALGGNFPISPAAPTDLCGAAVDPSGNIWVGDYGAKEVREYSPGGLEIGSLSTAGQAGEHPCRVAFDAGGDLYVAFFLGAVWEYSAASGYTSHTEVDPGPAQAIAVDSTTGNLLVAREHVVVEYDSAGAEVRRFGEGIAGSSFSGITVDDATNDVYVADRAARQIHVFSPPFASPVVAIKPLQASDLTAEEEAGVVGATGYRATFHGEVNPEGIDAKWRFQYRPLGTTAWSRTPAVDGDAGNGSAPRPVEATAGGLRPHTEYELRLVADNGLEAEASESFTTPAATPTLHSASARPGATVASLYAAIDPNGEATSYRFEYGPTEAYGSSVPVPEGSAGSGSATTTVVAYLEGLDPGITYHFRLLARNEAGQLATPDHTFTTEPTPPARAYELVSTGPFANDVIVSPLLATANHLAGFGNFGLVAASGEAAEWDDQVSPPEPTATNGNRNVYVSRRDAAAGWSEPAPIAPPGADGATKFGLKAATPDLGAFVLSPQTYRSGTNQSEETPLLYRGTDGSFLSIVELKGEMASQLSADGSHVFLDTGSRLLPADTHEPGAQQLYEWTPSGGLRLAGVDGEGNPISPCGAILAGMGGSRVGLSSQDISSDGSRVLFQSPDPSMGVSLAPSACKFGGAAGDSYVSDLYLREGSRTVDISRPPTGVPDYGARLIEATPDLSQIFFVTESALTPDKVTEGPGHADLYRYETSTGKLTRISVGQPGFDDAGLGNIATSAVNDSALVSADGSTAYFTARGQLSAGRGATRAENLADETANLYRWREGAGISFVATIRSAGAGTERRSVSTSEAPLALATASVTPDGSDLLFGSKSRLTPYDNEGLAELYLYDATTGTIECPTCAPDGTPPDGGRNPQFRTNFISGVESNAAPFTANLGGLSADGSTVVFASTDRLLPSAVNEPSSNPTEPIFDVYAWHDGQLSLISTGQSESSDFLLGTSADGRDVFLATASQLVPADGDHAYDIYDARIGGGFAEPRPPAACLASECRGVAPASPVLAPPGSESVRGAGNLKQRAPRRCHKGLVRRHRRCVKVRTKTHRHHRTQHGHHQAQGRSR